MQSAERRAFPHRRGLIIVTTLATAYMASHFFRASNVTIGLDLMRDLAIGPEALGALTGAFFFGFAAMQIPCGFLFDRFGPRRSVAGMLILATLGGAVFKVRVNQRAVAVAIILSVHGVSWRKASRLAVNTSQVTVLFWRGEDRRKERDVNRNSRIGSGSDSRFSNYE